MELLDARFTDIITENKERKVEEFCTFQQGESVNLNSGVGTGSALIVAPQGIINRCEDPLSPGPAITLSRFDGRWHVRWHSQAIRPTKDVLFLDSRTSQILLTVVYGALRRLISDLERSLDSQQPSPRKLLQTVLEFKDFLLSCSVSIGSEEQQERFDEVARTIILHIDMLEHLVPAIKGLCSAYIGRYLQGNDGTLLWNQQRAQSETQSLRAVSPKHQKDTGMSHGEYLPTAFKELMALFDALRVKTGLDASDYFWEFVPLLVLKKRGSLHKWQQLSELAGTLVAGDSRNDDTADNAVSTDVNVHRDSLIQLLDSCLIQVASDIPLLEFLPHLSYRSSLLTVEQIAQGICSLVSLDPDTLTGSSLQNLAASVLDDQPMLTAAPPGLGQLFTQIIKTVEPQAETIYDPLFGAGTLLLLAANALPHSEVFGQSSTFQDELLVRTAFAFEGKDGNFKGSSSIEDDCYTGRLADCAVVLVPITVARWCLQQYPTADPRWVFGTPPPNRCIGAWIQQALSHVKEGGACICLVNNAFLHSMLAAEKGIRYNMVNAGLIECVIALPGRVLVGETAPMSVIVLHKPCIAQNQGGQTQTVEDNQDGQTAPRYCVQDQSAPGSILFIDAQVLGEPVFDSARGSVGSRILPDSTVTAIIDRYMTWRNCPEGHHDEPGFCKTMSIADILDNDALLTPWNYTKATSEEPQILQKSYAYLTERRQQLEEDLIVSFSKLIDSAQDYLASID
jgi:hypothetical protein